MQRNTCSHLLILPLLLFFNILLSVSSGPVWGDQGPTDDYESLRQQMVTRQLKWRGIRDERVLNAMAKVPRHQFAPPAMQSSAYDDTPLPISYDQTISQPYIVAIMSELLGVEPGRRVLEVGTGSGYQAAVLAEMGIQVFTIEILPELGRQAQTNLAGTGYSAVNVRVGDGYKGWPDHAPFDGIIVTCAPTHIPQPLIDQLAEGGRMVIPVGKAGVQELVLLKKIKGRIERQKIIDVRFVPMVNDKGDTY